MYQEMKTDKNSEINDLRREIDGAITKIFSDSKSFLDIINKLHQFLLKITAEDKTKYAKVIYRVVTNKFNTFYENSTIDIYKYDFLLLTVYCTLLTSIEPDWSKNSSYCLKICSSQSKESDIIRMFGTYKPDSNYPILYVSFNILNRRIDNAELDLEKFQHETSLMDYIVNHSSFLPDCRLLTYSNVGNRIIVLFLPLNEQNKLLKATYPNGLSQAKPCVMQYPKNWPSAKQIIESLKEGQRPVEMPPVGECKKKFLVHEHTTGYLSLRIHDQLFHTILHCRIPIKYQKYLFAVAEKVKNVLVNLQKNNEYTKIIWKSQYFNIFDMEVLESGLSFLDLVTALLGHIADKNFDPNKIRAYSLAFLCSCVLKRKQLLEDKLIAEETHLLKCYDFFRPLFYIFYDSSYKAIEAIVKEIFINKSLRIEILNVLYSKKQLDQKKLDEIKNIIFNKKQKNTINNSQIIPESSRRSINYQNSDKKSAVGFPYKSRMSGKPKINVNSILSLSEAVANTRKLYMIFFDKSKQESLQKNITLALCHYINRTCIQMSELLGYIKINCSMRTLVSIIKISLLAVIRFDEVTDQEKKMIHSMINSLSLIQNRSISIKSAPEHNKP